MGHRYHHLDRLPAPFALLDERLTIVPPGAQVTVRNTLFKCIFIYDGEFSLHGQANCEGQRVGPGDCLIFPMPATLEYRPINPRVENRLMVARIIMDETVTLTPPKKAPPPPRLADRLSKAFPSFCVLPGALKGEAEGLLARIFREIDDQERYCRLYTSGLLTQIMVLLMRHQMGASNKKASPQPTRRDEIVARADAYLVDNCTRPLRLSEIAWHLRLSEEHLARVYREKTGMSVFEAIRQGRIEHARRLLLGTNESMAVIAKRCGYASVAVFTLNFKRVTGLPPGAYRSLHATRISGISRSLSWNKPH